MPTSATGADRRHEAGFTLAELMVVVAIMGLLAAVVVVGMGGARPSAAQEADRFATRLSRAREEAVLTNRPVEVAVSAGGYAFRARGAAGWAPLAEGPFKQVAFESGTTVVDETQAGKVAFDSAGSASPAAFVFSRGAARTRVAVDGAGNVRIDDARAG